MVVAVFAYKNGQSLAASILAITDIQWLLHFNGPTLARLKKWSYAFQKDTRGREQRRQPVRTLSRRHLDIVSLRNAYLLGGSPLPMVPISRTFLDFLFSPFNRKSIARKFDYYTRAPSPFHLLSRALLILLCFSLFFVFLTRPFILKTFVVERLKTFLESNPFSNVSNQFLEHKSTATF